jgi:hypothetical protein
VRCPRTNWPLPVPMDDFRIHRPALLSASVSYLANASLSSTFFNSSTAATLLRGPVPQLIICESRPPAPIQAGALWSIEDRGKWLGFHRRAALPFGSASKFCGGRRRVAGTLRVGVLGAGWAGEAHVAAYSRLPGRRDYGAVESHQDTGRSTGPQTRICRPEGLWRLAEPDRCGNL